MSPTATVDVGTLYERHAPEIHDFLVRTVRDHAAAEDLTQTTFIRLMERGDSVREVEKVRPWLFTVAHNLAVTHVTRRRPTDPIEAAFEIASGEKGPEDEALAIAAAALVWDAAASLEPRQYAVLDLSVRRGFNVAEIAEVLEITPAHAAVVVHRAREALAQAIRLLVVVRQRRHCARLAELVPAGTDILTPDLRASVDRHMRRCDACKEVGAKLTEPDQLLGLMPLLPLPVALLHPPLLPHGAAPPHHAASLSHAAQRVGQTLMQPAALATMAALVVAGTGVGLGLALHHGGRSDGAVSAASTAPRSGLGTGPGGTAVAGQPPGGGSGDAQPAAAGGGSAGGDVGSAAASPGSGLTDSPIVPSLGLGAEQTAGSPAPAPEPSPIIDLPVGPVSTPAGPTGAHVVVWNPSTSTRPPTVSVTVAGQTITVPVVAASRSHAFLP